MFLQFGGTGEMHNDELTADSIERMKRQMTGPQWEKIYEMNRDRHLYQNLINSLFPSIHGNDQIKKGNNFLMITVMFNCILDDKYL